MPTQTRERLQNHIYGSLMAAALGDAMGAATEQHTIPEVIATYGGLLRELHAPSEETFSHGNLAGEVTDDSSQMFTLAQALIDSAGHLSEQDWIKALIHWSQTSRHKNQMGPTTRPLLLALAAGEDTSIIGTTPFSKRKLTSFGATNGAAMRIAPVGLLHPGDIEAAVHLAWTTARPTHDTQLAAASAGAIAAGVAHALLPEADALSVLRACLDGARLGEELGAREGRRVPGPSIARRIEIAAEEALRARSLYDAIVAIEAAVGNSVMAVESVPAAVGVFVAALGKPLDTVSAGASIGNDSDTIAAMAGALAGALHGYDAIPADLSAQVKAANPEDIEALAQGLCEIAWANMC